MNRNVIMVCNVLYFVKFSNKKFYYKHIAGILARDSYSYSVCKGAPWKIFNMDVIKQIFTRGHEWNFVLEMKTWTLNSILFEYILNKTCGLSKLSQSPETLDEPLIFFAPITRDSRSCYEQSCPDPVQCPPFSRPWKPCMLVIAWRIEFSMQPSRTSFL